ncbi:MAG: helix-turn-helix transcriptional regulator [Clostridia bacterium]|nr:helix-turn-helix transcriptional regulator [Clostridia bacterium]
MKPMFETRELRDTAHVYACTYKNLHNLPHWHIEHELIYVNSGRIKLTVNNNSFIMTEGMCAFVKSEETHYIKADAESITKIIKMDRDYVNNIIGQKSLTCPVLEKKYHVDKIFDEIFNELKDKREYSNIIADSIMIRLTADIFRNEKYHIHENTLKINPKYKELLDLISKNYMYLTFEDAAKFVNLSRGYFSKYFHQISGMTFTHYLNTIRVGAAVEKLSEGKMSITEVSISCGFGTIRNFNRIFKELTGYTPKQLPSDYVFIKNYKDASEKSFNPTLNCTEILSP